MQQNIIRHEIEILACFEYRYPIDRIIQQFKYQGQLHHLTLLTHLMTQIDYPEVHAVVPMPISTERLQQRGYNQSLLLAKAIAKKINRPVWQPIIRAHEAAQKGRSRLDRLDIEHQFKRAPPSALRYRRVLIVDDVVTTGSSVHALRQALYALGCRQVFVCALAISNTLNH